MLAKSFRHFSTFSKVQGTSIAISTHYPPKLRVPINEKTSYDFTLRNEESVDDLQTRVA